MIYPAAIHYIRYPGNPNAMRQLLQLRHAGYSFLCFLTPEPAMNPEPLHIGQTIDAEREKLLFLQKKRTCIFISISFQLY